MGSCSDHEIPLAAYALDALDDAELEPTELHVVACGRCQAAIPPQMASTNPTQPSPSGKLTRK